jgi:CheY-like chemotaxis protein
VDDDEANLNLIKKRLEAIGYSTETAEDGQVALQRLEHMSQNETGLPSLIISDVDMPHVDGIKLVRECRRLYPRLHVLITTGKLLDHQQELNKLGVPYLGKPYSLTELKSKIKDILNY